MATDPGIGYRIVATVVSAQGHCNAGHREGDTFEISCHNPAGLCGFFYHDIFPTLQTFQFGGSMSWWQENTVRVGCPDTRNQVTLRLERFERE
jgi:uncharacterized repeat protein (TIGR04076 family)